MKDLRLVELHPEFPHKSWIVIEQPRHEPFRYQYDPLTGSFTRTTIKSLIYERGFSGAYGWLGGTGMPPNAHYDVLFVTQLDLQPGDIVLGHICGVFLRNDGDHKFVALDDKARAIFLKAEIALIDRRVYDELIQLYPRVGENEGWFGAETAFELLMHRRAAHS